MCYVYAWVILMHYWIADLVTFQVIHMSCGSIGQPALCNHPLHLLSHFITGSIVISKWDLEFYTVTMHLLNTQSKRQKDNSCNIHVVTLHFMKVTHSLKISAFCTHTHTHTHTRTHSVFIHYTILTIKYFPQHHSLAGLCNWNAVFFCKVGNEF